MLAIRMRRMGSKKRPFFRIVVTDSRAPRESRAVEILGYYDPRTTPETVKIDHEAYARRLSQGARPSDTVRTLVDRHPPVAEPEETTAAVAAAESVSAPAEDVTT